MEYPKASRDDLICKSESPIESKFFAYMSYEILPETKMEMQKWLRTPLGNFRADFYLTTKSGRTIVIELDGKQWHDAEKDRIRDLAIIGSCNVDRIYRIRGRDIVYNLDDVSHMISTVERDVFIPRRSRRLETMATEEALRDDQLRDIGDYKIYSRSYFDWNDPYSDEHYYDWEAYDRYTDDGPPLRPMDELRTPSNDRRPTVIRCMRKGAK